MATPPPCSSKHANTTWSSWTEYRGVTHMIEAREATCNECGFVVARQSRQGRKL